MMRPEDIKNRTFANALRGYDKDEVRSFLFKVAESSQELHDQLTATEAELSAAVEATREVAATPDVGAGSDVAWGDEALGDEALAAGDQAPTFDTFTDAGITGDTAGEGIDLIDSDAADVHDVLADAPTADHGSVADEVEDLAVAEQSIADRYGAIGDRIADLLRNADESAAAILASAEHDSEEMRHAAAVEAAQVREDAEAQAAELLAEARAIREEVDAYREQVTAELETARNEQETALAEAKAAAEAEVETFRVNSISEIETLRSDAVVEVESLRGGAAAEVDELRLTAQRDADALRESAIADGQSAIAEHEAEAARLNHEAENDRRAARAELDDVRSEVSSLLEQARTQSEFIKQEADEIIRTKVRSNFEQAQARIDVLRNTEIASRERIVRAQTELTSALTRLDSEPAPALDPSASSAVIDEAERRQVELTGPSIFDDDASSETTPPAVDADTEVFEVAEVVEADVVSDEHAGEGDAIEASDTEFADTDSDNAESADWGGQATFESDVAEAAQQIDAETDGSSPLSAFFGPGPETSVDEPQDSFAATEYVETEYVETVYVETEYVETTVVETEGSFTAEQFTSDSFDVTEHVVVESSSFEELPMRGHSSDEEDTGADAVSAGSDLPGSLEESLPEAPELGGREEEDALARLVREAMQEAVDSARKND